MSKETTSNSHEARTVRTKQGIWRTYDGADGLPAGVVCLLQAAKMLGMDRPNLVKLIKRLGIDK